MGPFMSQKNQHDLLYWPCIKNIFFIRESVCLHSMEFLHTFFYKFPHDLPFPATKNFIIVFSSSLEHTDLPPFQIASKETFCHKQISNNAVFTFMGEIRKKMYFVVFNNVGYHLPFQYNELGHLPYMAVALIPRHQSRLVWDQTTSTSLKSRFLLLKYILTLSLILCSYY